MFFSFDVQRPALDVRCFSFPFSITPRLHHSNSEFRSSSRLGCYAKISDSAALNLTSWRLASRPSVSFNLLASLKKTNRPACPRKTIYRLSIYLRCLARLKDNGIRTVSSEALAKVAGVKSTQLAQGPHLLRPVRHARPRLRCRAIVADDHRRTRHQELATGGAGGRRQSRSWRCSPIAALKRKVSRLSPLSTLIPTAGATKKSPNRFWAWTSLPKSSARKM